MQKQVNSNIDRRGCLQRMAAAIPASAVLGRYNAIAAPARRKVKVTGVKVMQVRGVADWPMVKIETDAGISGIGESYWGQGVKDIILGALRPAIIGEDPLDIDRLYTKMVTLTSGQGSSAGSTVAAISGVEIALWDTAGKILGAPVSKLLGGQYRDQVPAYWTRRPANPSDRASCREFASMLKSHPYGFKAIKCDFMRTRDPQEPFSRHWTPSDLRRNAAAFANIREALGDDYEIAVHCHWEFDWIDALNLARSVAPMNPSWLEDPLPPDFSETWVKLTAGSPVPILQGENLYTRHGFKPFIVNHGCHIIQIDIAKAGGLLESKKIADLADIYYMPVCAHNVASPIGTMASAHCAASIRDFRSHEINVGYPDSRLGSVEAWEKFAIYDRPFLKDGKIHISDNPGLGIELNEEHVRSHLVPGEKWWD
jgi:L-alanine-DL-glutamate epimerase-like enolase superfamily enzyme